MATEKIRVGIIGANVRNGWGRDAHIPALRPLPEFEITAVSTSRQEGVRQRDPSDSLATIVRLSVTVSEGTTISAPRQGEDERS
jgi:hypothetical protein